ncbi:MAG TPA: MBL fold metallo-hydrolase, partial [Limnochordia bacterium]
MRRLVLLFLHLASLAFAQELELHFIDVGQGDAILIRAPGGQNVLYDGGRQTDDVLTYLRSLGVVHLDLVIASHPDADHIGGLPAVVAAYQPRYFMDDGMPHTTQTYLRLLRAVAQAGSQLLAPTARTLRLGEVTLQVLPPPGDPELPLNDNSLGLLITYGQFQAALTGDAETAEFHWWASHHPDLLTHVDVYKAAHHGSDNGDTPLSMSRFYPEVVIISVGAGNSYGHPSDRALRLYRAIGARVLRTDLQGSIVVHAQADGSYRVLAERAMPTEPAPAAQPAGVAPATQRNAGVRIACVLYNPAGSDDGRERVMLAASSSVNVGGWVL